MAAASHGRRQPEIGRQAVMPINVVLVHIVIAASIIALAAAFADGGK
jgi:hypothetical protein